MSKHSYEAQDVAAITQIPQRVIAAWADHDADAFAAVFTKDSSMILPGDVYRKGRDEIRAFFAAGFNGPYQGTEVTGEPLDIQFVTPDVAVLITEGGVLAPGETTVAAERLIRATWVVAKQDNGWQLAVYHNSPVNI